MNSTGQWVLKWTKGKKGTRYGYASTVSVRNRWCYVSKKKGGPFVLAFAERLGKDPIECNTRVEAMLVARTIFRLEGQT